MLEKRIFAELDAAMRRHADESIRKNYEPGSVELEAGRRQGMYQGLQIARAIVEALIAGDSDDEASRSGTAVRRLG